MNFQKMMKQAKQMQNKLEEQIKEFDKQEFEFKYQNSITIRMLGRLEIVSIDIDKELIDPEDKIMLQEMVAEAINEAIESIEEEKNNIINANQIKLPF